MVQLLLQALAKQGASAGGSASMEFMLQDVEAAHFGDASFDFVLCSNGMAYLQVGALTSWAAEFLAFDFFF